MSRPDVETTFDSSARIATEAPVGARVLIGVQFHPESILTDVGKRTIENFCNRIATDRRGLAAE